MGLAGKKDKTKVGLDPRNTFWVKDTSRFGHKYLSNLGWTPGEALGDTTSSYHSSGHITDASTSGVKIQAKGDNLGIGAKLGMQDECTGLLGLQGLLGRLNGDEEAMKRVALEEDRRTMEYITGKWGMKFVKGEVWQADDFAALVKKRKLVKEEEEMVGNVAEKKKEKKRKRDGERDEKQSRKSKKREKSASAAISETEMYQPTKRKSNDGTSKREKSTVSSDDESESKESSKRRSKSKSRAPSNDEEKSKRKAEKRRRKEEKRQRKEKKKEKKAKKEKEGSSSESESESESEDMTTTSSTPAPPIRILVGRHAIRARYIAAKRSAVLDSKSLNEILMVKA